MKKITLCFSLLLLLVYQGHSQVSLGDGTSTNKHVPFEPSFDYSYAQSIYLASEISASGDITSIQWYFNGSSLQYSQNITIYLGHTTKSEFSSNEDWESSDNLVQAYSGPIPASGAGWVNIGLQMPFSYNGTDNLVVAVKEGMIGSDLPNADFWAYQVPSARSLSSYGYDPIDISSPPYAEYRGSYVPNIIFGDIIQICPFPINLNVSDITSSSVLLAWETVGAAPSGGSQYYISESTENPTILTAPTGSVASGNSVEVTTGLDGGTVYNVWIRDVCEGVPGNWSPAVSFVTDCLPTATFSENFDGTDSGLPLCWSSIVRGSVVDPDSHATIVNWSSHSGTNAVEFYSSTNELILVSPLLNNLEGSNRVRFFASTNASYNNIVIGTLDSNTEEANFTPFAEVEVTPYYSEHVVDLSDYIGSDTYLGFRMVNGTAETSVYVDDIHWEAAPVCADVSQIAIPLTTPTTATVSWVPSEETEWKVVYAPSTVQDPTGLAPIAVTANPTTTIAGLLENTSYNVWVSSVCEAGQGFWVGPVTFTTACIAIDEFNENFDLVQVPELPSCWTKLLRGNTIADASINTEFSDLYSAPVAVVLNSASSTVNDDVILVSPNLGDLTADKRLKFFAKQEGGLGSLQIGTLSSNTDAAVFTLFQEVTTTDVLAHYTVDFSLYSGSDKYIGIRTGVGNYIAYTIDDIEWKAAPICQDPTDLSVSEIDTDAATLQWVAGGSESQWQVAYGPVATLYPDGLTPSAVLSAPTVELSLSANTSYHVWVRSVCSAPDSTGDWVGPLTFTTPCIAVSYLNENFDTVEGPQLPGCWSSILRGETLSDYATIENTDYYLSPSLSNSVKLSNAGSGITDDIILVSPKLDNIFAGSRRLKFYAKKSAAVNVQIGTLDSNTATATFHPVGNVTLTNDFAAYIVDFTVTAGSDSYIGFRVNAETDNYGSFYIDNVIWEEAPLCVDLSGPSVTGTTTSTAVIAWVGGNGTSQAQVAYGPASVTDPATLVAGALLTGNTTELTGLTSDTAYKFWVRSVCTAPGGNGAWIGPMEFSTKCLSGDIPYTEDFEGLTAPNLPNCSSVMHLGEANNWNTGDDPFGAFETIALTYGGSNVPANAWFFTQGLNLIQGNNYTISYDYGKSGFENTESLKVMYGTAADAAAMTLPLVDHPEVTNDDPATDSITFTAAATGIYYFGFNAYSGAGQDLLIVDNISIQSMLSNGDLSDGNFSYYPNPVKSSLHLSYTQNISNVAVYTILGQKVIENAVNANSVLLDMSPLSRGTYIVKVTSDKQTKTIKVIKE